MIKLRYALVIAMALVLQFRLVHAADRLSELEREIAVINAKLAVLAAEGAPADAAALSELQAQVQALAEEIATLRATGSETPESTPATQGGRYGMSPAASRVYESDRGVSIGGYGELLYQNFAANREDGVAAEKTDTADAQRLVLYFGHRFNSKIIFNSEIEYEHAVAGDDTEGEVAVEFAYLDFLIDPRFNIRTGLVLLPVGMINELHEPPTFLGARRPDVERFIIPATWSELGVGVFGDLGPVTYRAYLTTALDASGFSASEGIREGRQEGSKASAEDFAISARLDYHAAPGLLVGVSAYRGNSGQSNPFDAAVTLLDAHADFTWRGLQLRGLWARTKIGDAKAISNSVEQVIGSSQQGGYLQAGYDLLAHTRWNRRSLIPFVRSERFDTQHTVADGFVRDDANRRRILTYGVVFKPIPQVAIKADFQDMSNDANTGVDQFNVAVGFLF